MKAGIIAVVVVAVLGVGGLALTHKSKPSSNSTNNSSSNSSSDSSNSSSDNSSSSSAKTGTDFTINANDDSADVETLNVKKGDAITVTFKVDTNEVYHGGLEFKSDTVSSKPIKPGDSDTVHFTADKSFDFTPFWYQSSIQKDYLIHVNVT